MFKKKLILKYLKENGPKRQCEINKGLSCNVRNQIINLKELGFIVQDKEQKYHISDKKIPDIDCQYFEFLGFTEKSPENAVTPKNIQKQLDNIKGKDKSLNKYYQTFKSTTALLSLPKFQKTFDNLELVFAKVVFIDSTNSTNLRMAANIKANTDDNDIEVVDTAKIAKILSEMKGIDEAIKNGDTSIVSKICKKVLDAKGKNIPSFASKYCLYHNKYAHDADELDGDAFSIYDSILATWLPKLFEVRCITNYENEDLEAHKVTKSMINNWNKETNKDNFNKYPVYVDYITCILNAIREKYKEEFLKDEFKDLNRYLRRNLDLYIWSKYRKQ